MPAGSKTDPTLAKAKPISDGGSASGVIQLRRGKKHQEQLQPEKGVRTCERNNSSDTKVSEEERGGGVPGTGAEIPLQPTEKTMMKQAVPLQPMEDPTLEQVEAPEGAVTPWEAHAGASFWQDLWSREEGSPRRSRFAGRTCDPVGDPRWSSLFLKVCTLWKGPMLEQFVKNCSQWEGLTLD
ncbi:hypothetical protein GRJ2_000597300 [Grus japonensis]|uniref:Uncharacterized protein n=1 Tax=Grus japonensis TaxID=30415 RepID=A0ABC9W8B8_GRUJA